jgi:hypothetical protein
VTEADRPDAGVTGPERRLVERVHANPLAAALAVVGARLVDASAYGLRIESPLALEAGAVVPLRLVIHGQKSDMEARVVSCALLTGTRRAFAVGLELVRIESDARARLEQVLEGAGRMRAIQAARARADARILGSSSGGSTPGAGDAA